MKTYKEFISEAKDPRAAIQKKIEHLDKKIEDAKGRLGLAREKRRMGGVNRSGASRIQGTAEMKISSKISDLMAQKQSLQHQLNGLGESKEDLQEWKTHNDGPPATYMVDINHRDGQTKNETKHQYMIKNAKSERHARNIAMIRHQKVKPMKTGDMIHTGDTVKMNEEAILEAIKGWKNAHNDIMKNRAAQGKEVYLHSLKKDGKESGLNTARKAFKTEEEARAYHEQLKKLNPTRNIRHNLYVPGKEVEALS